MIAIEASGLLYKRLKQFVQSNVQVSNNLVDCELRKYLFVETSNSYTGHIYKISVLV